MDSLPSSQLIYDWNKLDGFEFRHKPDFQLNDETLRDGLQSPSVRDPELSQKIRLLHLMEELGVHSLDIGLPGAGAHAVEHIEALMREIVDNRMEIEPNCAVRTVLSDIEALLGISERTGKPIEAATFIGSSPIRQFVEDWTLDHLLKLTEEAVSFAVGHGLPVMYVTEDTTRAQPDDVRALYSTAIRAGAKRICVCDTVGHVTPVGVRNLLHHVRKLVDEIDPDVKIDWHGHCDRGLAIPNTMMAIASGVDRVHACGLGIGERCGNTPMDQLMVNLKLEGLFDGSLEKLSEYVHLVSESTGTPIPRNYPVFGEDAFRTATGVHAAAVVKALRKGDQWLADRVYSGVPAGMVGEAQEVEIGYMSGRSNVDYWLESHGYKSTPELVQRILTAAKETPRVLTPSEIHVLVEEHRRQTDDDKRS
ncbi:MAG: 2-isopropylmalate synthase [Candidatus Latescibacterota bacterium]|nr:MAG: 2-isopropylmalate synthase [Candidatus Latescibacterota bacterium]